MDIRISVDGPQSLKEALTITIGNAPKEKPKKKSSPLREKLMDGPRDKFGVPYVKPTTQGYAG